MRILAISGSPRKGNSEILLTKALELCQQYNHQISFIKASDLNISGCTECDGCRCTGECIIRDDMDEVYNLIKQTHRIIIASPIFFFGISGQLKLLIDRCQCFWYAKYILKKPIPDRGFKRKALLMLVGGMKKGQIGVECSEATIKAFLRTINVKEHDMLSYLGFDEAGSILKHPSAMNDVIRATRQLLSHD